MQSTAEYPNLFEELEAIALGGGDRPARARRAADRIRREGPFRRVGIYDMGPGGTALLGASGLDGTDGRRAGEVVVPVRSRQGDPIGAVRVEPDSSSPLGEEDRLQLQACAGVLWWLWAEQWADT